MIIFCKCIELESCSWPRSWGNWEPRICSIFCSCLFVCLLWPLFATNVCTKRGEQSQFGRHSPSCWAPSCIIFNCLLLPASIQKQLELILIIKCCCICSLIFFCNCFWFFVFGFCQQFPQLFVFVCCPLVCTKNPETKAECFVYFRFVCLTFACNHLGVIRFWFLCLLKYI